jgi:putative oxidoreductase
MTQATLNPINRPGYTAGAAYATSADDAGKLLFRVLIGALILLHGIAKIQGGIGPIVEAVSKAGLPSAVAYLAYVGEVLAPALLIAGIWTRAAALVVAINMVFAILLVHSAQVFTLGQQGGWAIELQALYLFGAIGVALLGAGRYSVGGIEGRWN